LCRYCQRPPYSQCLCYFVNHHPMRHVIYFR
jgi:hypothetical protein